MNRPGVNEMNRYWLGWGLWGLLLAVWTIVLLRPEPVTIQEVAVPSEWRYLLAKGFHVGMYGILAAWGGYLVSLAAAVSLAAIRAGNTTDTTVACRGHGYLGLILLGHGGLTEILQTFTSKRHGSVVDVLWDGLGVILGLLILWVCLAYFSKRAAMVSK